MLLVGVILALVVIAGRLVLLQGVDPAQYAARAQQQRLRTVTLTAERGAITDRTGAPLAVTVAARDVYADPSKVVDPQRAAAELAPLLGRRLADVASDLRAKGTFVYLARTVEPELARRVLALDLAGIGTLPTTERVYPGGTLASNVIGFVGTDGRGLAGMEYARDATLRGRDGRRTVETDPTGRPLPDGRSVLQPAVPGTGLRLTLDRDIQWRAQQAIAAQVKATEALSGTVIVMQPRTGKLLAVATSPGFDANKPGAAPPKALGDPAVTDPYEPGSVNKVVTMAAGIDLGLITPNTPFTIPNRYPYGGTVFRDAEDHPTWQLTATGVLAKSSNIGAIQVADRIGKARLYRYLRAFGFGSSTRSGLPGEGGGILPPPEQWSATTLPTVAFGQGVSATALQVASAFATIANDGVRVQPSVVAGKVGADGRLRPAPAPKRSRVVSSRTARQVRDMLEAVTGSEGTAPAARIPGYRVAGKTGTANRPNGKGGYSGYTASFAGFAPADKPQLLVEVVVQAPKKGFFGGVVSAPVFREVMSFALAKLRIPPTGTRPPTARLTWN